MVPSWWELLHLLNCHTDQQPDARPVPCPVGQPDSLLPPGSLPVHLAALNLTCGEAPRGASFPSPHPQVANMLWEPRSRPCSAESWPSAPREHQAWGVWSARST